MTGRAALQTKSPPVGKRRSGNQQGAGSNSISQRLAPLVQFGLKNWPWLLAAALLLRFAYKVVSISLSFPNLFQGGDLFASSWPLFVLVAAIPFAAGAVLRLILRDEHERRLLKKRLAEFLRAHAPGLLLGFVFFAIYFVLAAVFNRADFNNNNVFFAADSHQWQVRLADPSGSVMEMRAVHPLAFLLLRPLALSLSTLSRVDLFHSVLFLLAVTGSFSVFLAWIFIKDAVGSTNYAFLFASIFGISTSQLMFNTITETYVFSGLLLIVLFVLLQKKADFRWLILSGIGIFGVTISNLVQVAIGLFLIHLKVRRTIFFVVVVVAAAAGLSLVNKVIYPNSGLFFKPADYGVEKQHYYEPSGIYGWPQRANIVASDMFAFSVVAPQPYLQSHNKDDRGEFPKFNFMQGTRLSRFVGAGKFAIWLWMVILVASVLSLGHSLSQEGVSIANRFALAFLFCLGFNLLFHLFYGFEPFLYAADWTYALLFFVALSLRSWVENRWLLIILIMLLALLTLNNLSFLYFLMNGISPYIAGP